MSKLQSTDIELVQATLTGNAGAYRTLVERHERRIYRFLLKHVARADEAEDLSQETFLQAYRSLASYRCDGQFGTWLVGIALNVTRNHHNRSRSPPAQQHTGEEELQNLLADSVDPADAAQMLALLRALQRAIVELPPEQRECVTLIALEGLGYEEASRVLGVQVGTVKSRLSRARARLAQVVKNY